MIYGGATITKKKRTNMTVQHFEQIMFLKCKTKMLVNIPKYLEIN